MKKIIILVCMAAVIAVAASVSDSLFAAGRSCQCFDDSTAFSMCYDWCYFQYGAVCNDVLPFGCECESPFNGGECGCQFWAVCSNYVYTDMYLLTENCDQCAL